MRGQHLATVGLSLLPVVSPLWAGQDRHLPTLAEAILSSADELELQSLDPGSYPPRKPAFHGWKVLGSFRIRDTQARAHVVGAIRSGIAESDGPAAICFNPRHGLRATSPQGSVDLVICFECGRIEVYVDGRPAGEVATGGSAQPFLDGILRNAKVPLPKHAGN